MHTLYLRHRHEHHVSIVLQRRRSVLHDVAVFGHRPQHDVLVVANRRRRVFEAFGVHVDLANEVEGWVGWYEERKE